MERDPQCIFCKIVAGEIPCFKVYEDDATLAFMDINPTHPGHALAIAKAHFADLYAIPTMRSPRPRGPRAAWPRR